VLSFSGKIIVSSIIMSIVAFFMVLFSTLLNTSLQFESDDTHRGRVMAVYSFVFVGIAPIGSIYAGSLSNWIGARGTYLVSGLIGIMGTLLVSILFYQYQKKRSESRQASEIESA
jgi:MFS family permease